MDASDLNLVLKRIRWNPFFSFLMREVHRFYKVLVQTVVIPVVTSSLYFIIFGISLGSRIQFGSGNYLEFIIPGLVMMSCLTNSFQNGSSSILSLKFGGDIIDVKASALTVQQTLWALALGGIARGILVGSIVLCAGEFFHLFYLGEFLRPHSYPAIVFFALISGMVFSKMGAGVALWAKTFDHIGAVSGVILLPLTYLGGVFFSLDILSPFWQKVSLFNPVFYFINGIRWGFLGRSDVPPILCVLVSLGALVIFHAICFFTMKYGSYRRW